jgi:hypothetical protein
LELFIFVFGRVFFFTFLFGYGIGGAEKPGNESSIY